MNILANSSLAASPAEAPSQGWSTAANSASDADGQPAFVQVVQETLNRTGSAVPEQQAPASNTAAPSNAQQQLAVVCNTTNAGGEPMFAQNLRDASNQTSGNAPEQQAANSKATDATGPAQALSTWLSTVVNAAIDANGQPIFAPVARGLLNRVSNNAAGQPVSTSNTPDSTPALQTPPSTSSLKGLLSKAPATSKQTNSPQAQLSIAAPGILQVPFAPVLLAPTPDSIPSGESAAASPAGTTLENAALSPAISTPGGDQVLQVGVNGSQAIQFFSQLQATLASVASVTPATDSTSPAAVASPTKDAGPSTPTPVAGAVASSVEIAVRAAANAPSNILPNALSPAEASPVKTEIGPQPAAQPPDPLSEDPVSSVLKQVAALQGTAPNVPSSPAAAASLAASDTKATQSASMETRSIEAAQAAASAANNRPSSQDSSSNPGGQNAGDFSESSDASSTQSPQEKNEFAAISGALSAVSAVKPGAAQPAQATQLSNAAPPAPATPPPPSEPNARAATEPESSDPADAQQPSAPPQTSDAPSGRFVNDAQLMNAASQSEMHIAMQTNKLGAIEIHARVSGDEIGAAIIVDKRDAHAALAVELPALQQALSDKQLRVEQVVLTQGSLNSTAGGAGGNAQHQQRGTATSPQTASFWNEARSLSTAAWFVTEQTGVFNDQGRLSVQA
jgi:Flagellar hook-length control protein FliK